MILTEELLMAYADGEADAQTRAAIESAMRDDPNVRSRVEHHCALRAAMQGAFSSVLAEPVPESLIDAARGRRAAAARNVVGFARIADAARAISRPLGGRHWQPVAMAASLLIGLGVGYASWHNSNALLKSSPGQGLIAGAALTQALSSQLSADRSAGSVAAPGISYRDKSGHYCRTFSLIGADRGAGLACREGDRWKIKVLAQSSAATADASHFRQAGSGDASAVRAAVEESIAGEPLDQAGEIAARASGWAAAANVSGTP